MRIELAPRFNRIFKKLEPVLKQVLGRKILALVDNPYKGDRRKGVLRVLVEKAVNDQ